MSWLGSHALLGITGGLLGACTLTSDDFHPLRVDPIPMAGAEAPAPVAPDCNGACDGAAASSPAATDPAGSATPPGETPAPSLPLQNAGAAGSSGSNTPEAGAPTPNEVPAAPMEAPPAAPAEPGAAAEPAQGAPPPLSEQPPLPEQPIGEQPPLPEQPIPEQPIPEPLPEPPLAADLLLVGWASVAGLGTPTTTGGAAGATVIATTAEQLEDFASRPEPLTILVEGTLRAPRVSVASDKTLRGVGPAPRLEGGLRIRGRADAFVRNVIVQNLAIDASFSDVEGDGVQIHYAHHVWVDHCDVHDAPDGNVDIVHGSDFVTVSWSRFAYGPAVTGGRLSTQIGHSDSAAAEDTGHLRVTLHHDLWATGMLGSMPSARFGDVHVFNSYYASPGADTAITAALGSRLLVEDNYFEGVPAPFRISGGTVPEPELRAIANVVTVSAATLEVAGAAFVPPYPYTAEAAEAVPERLRSAAGATLSFPAPLP